MEGVDHLFFLGGLLILGGRWIQGESKDCMDGDSNSHFLGGLEVKKCSNL